MILAKMAELQQRNPDCDYLSSKPKDQCGTPADLLKVFKDRYKLANEDIFDVCPFEESWDAKYFMDALRDDWPLYKICWCNPPFS